MDVMKSCTQCQEQKPLEDFAKRGPKHNHRRDSWCNLCRRGYQIAWYRAVPAEKRANRRSRADDRREQLRNQVYNYLLTHPCVDCGESDPIVLEFDHIGTDKVATISCMVKNRMSWERILAEIRKCVVRCANCHRRVTAARAGFWRAHR
jgi:hypothetical protein